jgi:hypothetical protein
VDEFERRWLAFVGRYADATDEQRVGLVRSALDDGLPPAGEGPAHSADVAPGDRFDAEAAVVRASGEFDAFGYWWHNQDRAWNLCGSAEELRHFVAQGWKELRHPSPSFDLWFYWSAYLDPTRETVNPFLHYLLEGRRAGLATLPEVRTLPPAQVPTTTPRRVCLFAAYDVDGVVDPTVVDYLADLSRFADVYYLADCEMDTAELDKVAPYTKGRWAIRHGRYDFGSYSMLARDLVGWETIETYDELLLANDSCYLVQPFDQVFERMDATACDWWGLQATYEDFDTFAFDRLGRPLAIDEVEEQMRRLDLWRYNDFIHVGSYFVAYRKRVIDDPQFRARLDAVAAQTDKTTIILKYEIGFSRLLILGGYHLATFVDGILPYHPVYRESAFDLMREGFPLLKRQFLYENPFSRPDLRRWKERVLEVAPDADVTAMERNLHRVAPAWSLHRSFAFRSRPDGSVEVPQGLGPDTFDDEDRWTPKHPHWWVFPVDPRTGVLPGELRGLLEAVRDDASIHKIVLSAHRPVKVSGERLTVVPAESGPGQMYALRAGHLFVSAGPRSDVNHPLSARHHRFVRLGSPTGLEPPRVGLTGLWGRHDPPPESYERSLVTDVVVSSGSLVDDVVAIHPRVEEADVWVTGSPRVDLLLADEADLSATLRADLSVLRTAVAGRRVVVVSPLSATADEVSELARWAEDHEDVAVLWAAPPGWSTPAPLPLVDLYDAARLRPDSLTPHPVQPEMAWRLADVVATGWVGDLADAAVLPRPVVALPGASGSPLVEHPTLADGLVAVEAFLDGTPVDEAWLAWGRSLHTASDGRSGARLARRVKGGYLPLDEWERDLSAG